MIHGTHIHPDIDTLSRAAADYFVQKIQDMAKKQDIITIAIPGGNTVITFFEVIIEQYTQMLPWEKIHFFSIDEQWSPGSSRGWISQQAHKQLYSKLNIPKENIHLPPLEVPTVVDAAIAYEAHIRKFCMDNKKFNELPLDMVILGMGTDGHIASIYKNTSSIVETENWIVPVVPPGKEGYEEWITMTLPFISHTNYGLFMVFGKAKQPIINEILYHPKNAEVYYPAAMFKTRKELQWFIDQSAAG